MALPVIIIGGGGHARVLADCLLAGGRRVLGFTAPEPAQDLAPHVSWLGTDDCLAEHPADGVELANGLGSTSDTGLRRARFEGLTAAGYRFAEVRHPSAVTSALAATIGHGCQFLAGSIVGPNVRLGDNVLVNSRAVVEHDSVVEDHVHIATGAILCGGCRIGAGSHIGAGAVVIQGLSVGPGAIIAAGAVVTKNVEAMTLVAGVPASCKRARNEEGLEGNHG
jgi:sugar O-acyltransferase (sialic acid O-acetyltransferase NeuD family)